MDYKELIERLAVHGQSAAYIDDSLSLVLEDATTAIQTLLAERDAAINLLRGINWCCGCAHFAGLKGCNDNSMDVCCKEDDHYRFCGSQKGES